MRAYARLEQYGPQEDTTVLWEGEFFIADEQVIEAANSIIEAFAREHGVEDRDDLELHLWPYEMPATHRRVENASITIDGGRLGFDPDQDEGVFGIAPTLLAWGAIESFSSVKDHNVHTHQDVILYWYHPRDGVETGGIDEDKFTWATIGYADAWIACRARQDASTWKPGEARRIESEISGGSWNKNLRAIRELEDPEAKRRLDELMSQMNSDVAAVEDYERKQQIHADYRIKLAGLRAELAPEHPRKEG